MNFWLNKAKKNKEGFAPIWARITIDGKRTECSTHNYVQEAHWDSERNVVRKQCVDAININNSLAIIRADMLRQHSAMASSVDNIDPLDLKSRIFGTGPEKRTFLSLFAEYNTFLKGRVEIGMLTARRHARFEMIRRRCRDYISNQLRRADIPLTDLKLNFLSGFEHYVRTKDNNSHNTAMKFIKDIKQVTKYGVMMDYMATSPFEFFKCTFSRYKRKFLNADELKALTAYRFDSKRLEETRDCYLFSCYTGYAYSELRTLTTDHLTKGIDGETWIIRDRHKTDERENVPLLPVAKQLVEKYKQHEVRKIEGHLFPVKSNQKYNSYLKEIAVLAGIKKNLTTHTARHTFATTVLLTNGVPIETISELLGHNDIRTTQIYAKIVQQKISTDMQILKQKLDALSK